MNYIHFIMLSLTSPLFTSAMENLTTKPVQRAKLIVYGPISTTNYAQCIALMHSIMAGTCEIDGDNLEFPDTKDSTQNYATPFNTVHHALAELMGKDEPNLESLETKLNALPISQEEKNQLILNTLSSLTPKDIFQIQLDEFKEFYQCHDLENTEQQFKLRRRQIFQSLRTANKSIFNEVRKLKLSEHPIKSAHAQIEAIIQKYTPIK